MCNTDDADSFIRSLVVSSWPIRARFEWRVPRCETRQITDYFCVRRLIIHVRCPVAERTGSPQQVVLFPPSYCRTSVQLVYIQDADIFVEQNLEQKLIYIFRLNLCKGFWWDIYRVSIYSWNILWRIDSRGQNKHKSWYAKMLVEAWLLSYKQFKVFVRWNEVETEGNDGDRAILLYLEFHFAKRKLRLLII